MNRLSRLLRPRSIAVVGGGVWCANTVMTCRKMGFSGALHTVHPSRAEVGGVASVPCVADLPAAPDAVFVGVNRAATVEVVAALSAMGAGGAVCFASGYAEAEAETGNGRALQAQLLQAAGDMPILGPNCYGFINCLDGAALWPDQHGAAPAVRGVAIVTQSSNIAINLTMQRRGLPIAYVVTVGNQAQTGLSAIGRALLDDPRVTALGLHIEGIGDLHAFEALAAAARAAGKPIAVLKVGTSDAARAAAVSHTASLAGSAAGARALMARLGIGQVADLAGLIETLKLLHGVGPLARPAIASMSCSGGEASLMADLGGARGIDFPPLAAPARERLAQALGPKVALANPLDYHTYIWGDEAAMRETFAAMLTPEVTLGALVVDYPRDDRCSVDAWAPVITAAAAARAAAGVPLALMGSLPENLPETVAETAEAHGLVPLCGLAEGLDAVVAAAAIGGSWARPEPPPVFAPPGPQGKPRIWDEAEAKAALASHGLAVPEGRRAASPPEAGAAAEALGFPVALKGEGVAHKTEAGAVRLGLRTAAEVASAARAMRCDGFLVERMVTGAVAELLLGVTRDPAHGYLLTLAAGGTLGELLADSAALLLPAGRDDISRALAGLRVARILGGYRGAPAADMQAVADAALALQEFVIAQGGAVAEAEINPLICTPGGAWVADALVITGEG